MRIRAARYLFIAIILLSTSSLPNSIGQVAGSPQSVVWTNVTNCTVVGNSLQKTAGRSDSADAGARSQQTVTSGDALFEFTAGELNKVVFCGLTHSAASTSLFEIDFAIKLTEFGVAEVRENNDYGSETPYRAGDVFRIAVQSGSVSYYKNGGFFYSSRKSPSYPLFADVSFITVGAKIDNPMVGAFAVSSTADWTAYQHDPTHSGFSSTSLINISNVASLTQAWSFTTGGWVTGTPIVSDGTVYIGSWDGNMYALRERDGGLLWSFNAGTLRVDACGTSYGIDSTAALSGDTLYFGTGLAELIALNAANGQPIWRKQLADPNQAFHIFGSPTLFDGKIYIGLASHCVTPCVIGRLVCVDAADGRVLWSDTFAPEGSLGGAIWSSVAVDGPRRTVFVGTGNFCTGTDTHSSAVVALNADTGAMRWEFKRLQGDHNNLDFGASAVLFDIDGTPALAIPSKDGHCYALNRQTGALLWDTVVTDGNSIGGSISSPAVAYGKIFFGATIQLTTGKVVALDQRDGRIVWETPQSKKVFGATAVSGGVVMIAGFDGQVHAYDASTGAELWNAQRGQMLSGVSLSSNAAFVGSLDSKVYAFTLANPATPSSPLALTVASPSSGDEWGIGTKYTIDWSATSVVSRVDVSISRDGGNSWDPIASGLDATVGTLRFKAKKPRSETVLVRVSDSANAMVFAESGMFHIR